jgi:hypothetical protein
MLPFFVGDYMFHQTNPIIKIMGLINKEAWAIIMDFVKKQCPLATIGLIINFGKTSLHNNC